MAQCSWFAVEGSDGGEGYPGSRGRGRHGGREARFAVWRAVPHLRHCATAGPGCTPPKFNGFRLVRAANAKARRLQDRISDPSSIRVPRFRGSAGYETLGAYVLRIPTVTSPGELPLMPLMRTNSRWAVLSVFALSLAIAGAARADKLLFSGTHAIKFSHNGVIKEVSASGTGVAIANGKAGPLHTVELTRPFAQITDTVLATVTGVGLEEIHFDGVRINPLHAGPGGMPGLFAPIQGAALTRSTLPAAGTIRLCNLTGCPKSVVLDLSQDFGGAAVGPGVGGTIMATGTDGTIVTAVGQPWTVKSTTVSYETAMGTMVATFMDKGFAKGPLGNPGTTLDVTPSGMGGTLQLVSGTQTTCVGCGSTSNPSGQITRLTINFAPEPGLLALLGAGAAGLALLGRTRARR
jgi:hypothetical protein